MSNEPENSEDWFTSPIRTVIRERLFDEQLNGLAINHRRIDHVLSGIEYGLANHPELFPKVPSSGDSMVKTYFYPNAPAVRILFTYTATEVHLVAVEFAE
jgi:hypothetical protein